MNTNLEYIRTFLGESASSTPLLSDAELAAMISLSILRSIPPRAAMRLALRGVEWSQPSTDGLVRIRLCPLAHNPAEFHAGAGGWLDGAQTVRIGGETYEPAEGDVVDSYGGRVIFAQAPVSGSTVTVETYLIDLRAVLVEVLQLMRAAQARLSVRANLSGVGVDLTGVCARLQAEIDALTTGYELPFAPPEECPH